MADKNTKKEIAVSEEVTSLDSPAKMVNLAQTIAQVIGQKGLYTRIGDKQYINVEGWQVAGALTGIYPRIEKVENLSQGNVYRYRAEVSLFNIKTKETVGYGTAICTNTEPGKKNFAEYAVASMAQTRAVGKAFRLALGWLIKLSGYEATPAEEMQPIAYDQDSGKSETVEGQVVQRDVKPPTEKQLWLLKKLLKQAGKSDEDAEATANQCQSSQQASEWIEKATKLANGVRERRINTFVSLSTDKHRADGKGYDVDEAKLRKEAESLSDEDLKKKLDELEEWSAAYVDSHAEPPVLCRD